jgi:glycosyltransferase involved in cell wall biosynthesis
MLSVVIPTLGRSPALGAVLRRLEGAEVLLVVDAAGLVPGVPPHVRLLRADTPGASAARNVGWRAAGGDVVLFLGDDIVASRGLLDRHRAHHAAHPEQTAALLGRVFYRRRTAFLRWLERGVQTSYGSIDGDRAGWGHFYTTNVSVKRALLERAGGFDESLPFLYEDLDLGRRLADLGMDLRYDPRAAGEHRHRTTLADWERRMEQIGAAERAFCERHPDVEPYFRTRLQAAAAGPRRGPIGRRTKAGRETTFGGALLEPFMRGWDAGRR